MRVAAALRAGAPSDAAWAGAASLPARAGVPSAVALARRWPADPDGVAGVLAAARLSAVTGAPLADVLERLADGLVEDARVADHRRAAFAGPRATARLLAALPALGIVVGAGLGAEPAAVLLDGGAGSALLAAGAVLAAAGQAWTRRCLAAAGPVAGTVPAGPGAPRASRRGRVHRLATPTVTPPPVRLPLLLDLLAAVCAAGAGVTGALAAVGAVAGGPQGSALVACASVLSRGGGWDEVADGSRDLEVVADALAPSWHDGVPPVPALRAAASRVRREDVARATEAAARLGVRLVLPLGLCHLPAFVAVGVAPVVLSLVSGALA